MLASWALCALAAFATSALAQGNLPGNETAVNAGNENYSVETQGDPEALAACTHMCTVYTTFTEIRWKTKTETQPGEGVTKTITSTETVFTTDVEWTTEWIVTTTTKTFETSYPVTTTTVIDCVDETPYPTGNPEPTYGADGVEVDVDVDISIGCCNHPPPVCGTITTTEWVTTTTTSLSTVLDPTTTTKTVPTTIPTTVPTTIPTTVPTTIPVTRTSATTIWQPTTSVTTTTVTTEVPVTVTSGTTVITTSMTTIVETTVSTFTTSVPVVTTDTVTAPGETVTEPGETVTEPGETVTDPGETITAPPETITMPGEVTTLPGSTVTTTVVEDGETITTTVVVPPSTVTQPGTTVTATRVVDISVCPEPTGSSAPVAADSDLTFGCKPGTVCNPPMPGGCNHWPGPPSAEFRCNPEDCIPAPPFENVTWPEGETDYYPPTYGYFNLNPEAFGLSYDIFEYNVYEKVKHGKTYTITTGNWESQTSLSDWPRPTSSAHPNRLRRALTKRGTAPTVCFDDCNNAWKIAERNGKTDDLCEDGSDFRNAYDICALCIEEFDDETSDGIADYVDPELAKITGYCDGDEPEPTSTSASVPDSAITSEPDVSTTSQAGTSPSSFEPIPTTTTTDEPTSEPTTEPSSTESVPETTSTEEESTTAPSPTEETSSTSTPSSTEEVSSTSTPEPAPTPSDTTDEPTTEPTTPPAGEPTSGSPTVPVVPTPTESTPTTVPTAAAVRSAVPLTLGATLLSVLAAFFA